MTIYWNRSNQTKKTCLKLPNLLEWAVIFLTHIAQNQMPIMYKSSVKLMTMMDLDKMVLDLLLI